MVKQIEISNSSYIELLNNVKKNIFSSRLKAIKSVNKEVINSYFFIGEEIVKKQTENPSWGKSIVEILARDLKTEFPNSLGFSARNLWDMRRLYLFYKDNSKLRQLVAEIPWSHNLIILNKLKNENEIEYYLNSIIKYGWTRDVLLNQIKADAYRREKINLKQSNFKKVLLPHLSEQANECIKSSYNLDFLGIGEAVLEKELENKLIEKIKSFLLELGYGFAFIGNQYKLVLNNNEFFIDMLFYHRVLKCLIAIELKIGEFKPEYVGKMNFYLELLDNQLKQSDENPSIGIILCATKDDFVVEYSLKSALKPISVAEYELKNSLPKKLTGKLPSEKELKEEFNKNIKELK